MLPGDHIAAILLSERLALTAFVASVTRDFHLAEDIFQEVCVKAIGHTTGFESTSHLINWARLTGRNRAIDILRARDGRYDNLSDELLQTLASEWPDHTAADATHSALSRCLEELTPNNRELLRLRYFERRSGAEVAAHLGRKLESVYQALARIHKALGDCVRRRVHLDTAA